MDELLRMQEGIASNPEWMLLGQGAVKGVVEYARMGNYLKEDRFLDGHNGEGTIVVIGTEWCMGPSRLGRATDDLYPIDALRIIPDLRGVITLGAGGKHSSFYERNHNSHLDIVLRSLADPSDTPEPILAALGRGLLDGEREDYVETNLQPLQGRHIALERAGSLMIAYGLD